MSHANMLIYRIVKKRSNLLGIDNAFERSLTMKARISPMNKLSKKEKDELNAYIRHLSR